MAIFRVKRSLRRSFAATESDVAKGIQEVSRTMQQPGNSSKINPIQSSEIDAGWEAASKINIKT